MKSIKKLLSIMMVLAMVICLGANALAATVTITQPQGGAEHSYTAYQIFAGTQNADSDNRLGTVTWGKDIDGAAFLAELKASSAFSSEVDFSACEDAEDVVAVIGKDEKGEGPTLSAAELQEFGQIALKHMTGAGTPVTAGTTTLDDGYYVFKDVTDNALLEAAGDVRNDIVLDVTRDVDIKFKNDRPESKKQVRDINDSTEDNFGDWHDSADHDVGDTFEYRLMATLHDLERYDTYFLQFQDSMCAGLTFNVESAKVYYGDPNDGVDDVDVTSSFTGPTSATPKAGYAQAYTWTCDDVKTLTGEASDAIFYVIYTCTLNDKAVIGPSGNPNEMCIEFSRDPNSDEHGHTPWDKNIVFTYDLDVNKVNSKSEALTGAEFKLYKEIKNHGEGDGLVQLTEEGLVASPENGEPKDSTKWYKEVPLTVDGNQFSADRIDDGNYIIVETVAPEGYNKAAPIEFTITADHDVVSDNPTLKSLTCPGDFTVTPEANGGMISTNVVNLTGLELPSTGGIGTTIFYVVGAILVAGAVVLLVTKRRMNGAEK